MRYICIKKYDMLDRKGQEVVVRWDVGDIIDVKQTASPEHRYYNETKKDKSYWRHACLTEYMKQSRRSWTTSM